MYVCNPRFQPPPFRGCSRADFVTEGMPRKSETTRKRNRPDDGSHADLESNKLYFHSLSYYYYVLWYCFSISMFIYSSNMIIFSIVFERFMVIILKETINFVGEKCLCELKDIFKYEFFRDIKISLLFKR